MSKSIEFLHHDDAKRKVIPTAELEASLAEEAAAGFRQHVLNMWEKRLPCRAGCGSEDEVALINDQTGARP